MNVNVQETLTVNREAALYKFYSRDNEHWQTANTYWNTNHWLNQTTFLFWRFQRGYRRRIRYRSSLNCVVVCLDENGSLQPGSLHWELSQGRSLFIGSSCQTSYSSLLTGLNVSNNVYGKRKMPWSAQLFNCFLFVLISTSLYCCPCFLSSIIKNYPDGSKKYKWPIDWPSDFSVKTRQIFGHLKVVYVLLFLFEVCSVL